MEYNHDKVDDATLALLFLNMWDEKLASRAWKTFDWDTMDRLYEKGLICNPKGKAKSVIMTEEGRARAKELFHKMFDK